MSDYSAVAPPPQNFNQSTAFAAALQRAKQIAAKINPGGTTPTDTTRQKRPLEDGPEPDAKKGPSAVIPPPQGPPPVGRPPQNPIGMGGGPALGGGPHLNEDIKVPDKMVGLIIGRGGEQITRLQSESGCKIQMAPDSQGMPDRICSLSGTKEAITRAKELIMNIVHQRGRTEGLPGLDMGGGPAMGTANAHNNFQGMNNMNQGMGGGGPGVGGGGGVAGNGMGRNFVEIMIPGPKVGLIIGKGGETIKQLQEKSGAKMVVIQEGPNQEQEKPLRISGDPSKVEFAKQLVYDLIAEKEMQNFGRRGPGGPGQGGGGRNDNRQQEQYNDYGGGGGGGNDTEVLVPRQAVGVVIGKGGDMIKKIQAETGARVQFQQAREEGPGERRCYLSGNPKQVEQARQRIEELIDSVQQRDGGDGGGGRMPGGGGRGGRGGGRGGGAGDRYGGDRGRNGSQDYGGGGWDDRRQQTPQEVTFTVPSSKCGVIIGRGGETIKQINQQSGAYCELDRRSQNCTNASEKTFTIKGEPDQIEAAKRIISDKVQMSLNFINSGAQQMSNNIPTAYPGMAPQGYNPQNWGVPAYQQQWGAPGQGGDSSSAPSGQVQVNPSTGQPDYSLQWAEYYRSLGMHREAEMIEQQAKSKGVAPSSGPGVQQNNPQAAMPAQQQQASAPSNASNGAQPDYSAQWAEYYRSIGKHKEAEAIETQMKNKQSGQSVGGGPSVSAAPAQQSAGGGYPQQSYGAYQPPAGYYGGQPQSGVPGGVPQGNYSFPNYGYGGPSGGGPPNSQDN